VGKGKRRTSRAHVAEESEREVVPRNDSNKGGERLAKFGLELHPAKTRLIEFGR